MIKDAQLNLFSPEALEIEINGVRGVNSVDLYDLEIPFYNTYKEDKNKVELNQLIEDNDFFLNNTLSRDFFTLYNHFIYPFWKGIKRSEYWLHL